MKESEKFDQIPERTVANTIKLDAIVWVIGSNLNVCCGKVVDLYGGNQASVFVYDEWSYWVVDYDKIIRVGTSYYSDIYRNSTKANIR